MKNVIIVILIIILFWSLGVRNRSTYNNIIIRDTVYKDSIVHITKYLKEYIELEPEIIYEDSIVYKDSIIYKDSIVYIPMYDYEFRDSNYYLKINGYNVSIDSMWFISNTTKPKSKFTVGLSTGYFVIINNGLKSGPGVGISLQYNF